MPPPPCVRCHEVGGLVFDADFDSGNCARVEQRGELEFALWTRADAEGTPHQVRVGTWLGSTPHPVGVRASDRLRLWLQLRLRLRGGRCLRPRHQTGCLSVDP